MKARKLYKGMESPTLVPSSLECGDGCTVPTETLSDKTESSCTNQCSSPTACLSSSPESVFGPVADCGASPGTDLASEDTSVYHAAALLCSLRMDGTQRAQVCSNGFAGVNCVKDREEKVCKEDERNCAAAALESLQTDCHKLTNCCANTDSALMSDENNIDSNVEMLENGPKSDKVENGAVPEVLTSDNIAVAASKRCRHATADSSDSVHDYIASGCDVVFSDGIEYRPYGCERHLHEITELVSRDLSEPYSIYTYRYFIYNWPNLCFRVSAHWPNIGYIHTADAPCGLWGCKNRPAPFPGWMSYKVTKPGSVSLVS